MTWRTGVRNTVDQKAAKVAKESGESAPKAALTKSVEPPHPCLPLYEARSAAPEDADALQNRHADSMVEASWTAMGRPRSARGFQIRFMLRAIACASTRPQFHLPSSCLSAMMRPVRRRHARPGAEAGWGQQRKDADGGKRRGQSGAVTLMWY